MPNGQITEQKTPLEVYSGIPIEFQRLDGIMLKGILTMSPGGEWEVLAVDAEFMLNWAQRRFVGANLTSSAFPTHKVNMQGVRITSIVLTETQPTPTGA